MQTLRSLTALLLLTAFSRPVFADEKTPPPVQPPDPMMKILPEVNFQNVPLDDMIGFLQEAVPGFKAAVIRDAGVPDDYPQIKLKLKNVSMGQLWALVQMSYPDMVTEQVQAEGPGMVWMIRVHGTMAGELKPATSNGVKVYRLAAILDAFVFRNGQAKPGPEKKEALNHVLSLVKAALAQSPGKVDAILQVHEETETLVFKGTAEQRAAVQEVLDALDPQLSSIDNRLTEVNRQRDYAEGLRAKVAERAAQLEAELAQLRAQLSEEQKNTLAQSLEAEKLKVRLEENEKIDSAKADQQAKAIKQAAEQGNAELQERFLRLKEELAETRKRWTEAEHAAMQQSLEVEKLKLRLEESMRELDEMKPRRGKAASPAAPGSPAPKE